MIGFRPSLLPSVSDLLAVLDWTVEPMFGSYFATGGLILAMLAAWWFIGSDRALTFKQKATLSLLRLAMILIVGFLLLRPALTFTRTSQTPHSIAVLVDTSASMNLPSGIDNKSRWEIQKQAVDAIQTASRSLGEEVTWALYGYDRQMLRLSPIYSEGSSTNGGLLGSENTWAAMPRKPEGTVTDVGRGLSQILETPSDPPLLSVIWMGDGAQTVRADTSKAQQAVRSLTQLDIPLFIVGIGPRSGSDMTRDQSIEGVPDQLEAFAKNTVAVRGTLRATGLQNRELKIEALMIPSGSESGKKPTVLNQVIVAATSADQTIPFSLPIVAPEKGLYQVVIKAEGVEGEATLLNNEQTCFINVRDQGSRVLYLEGAPRQEQQFIRRALSDSPDLKIDFLWAPEAARKRWPLPLEPQLTGDTYDCVILGDLDSDALGPENLRLLVELIQRGAGLITLGGFHAYSSGGYADTKLAEVLPVKLNSAWRQKFGQPDNKAGQIDGPLQLIPRAEHPVVMLGDNALNRWKEVKPLIGANRWNGLAERPGVQWIAQSQADDPLIVSGESGSGRVLSIAFDSSYLWWRQGKSDVHRQFWRQAVLWTMRRRPPVEGLQIEMPRRTFSLGDATDYSIIWTPGADGRSMPKDIQIRWSRDGQDLGPLVPSKDGENRLIGKLNSLGEAGRYELIARYNDGNGQPAEARLPFVVVDMALEKIQSAPDWPLINQLATLNQNAGGRIVAPESASEIVDAIKTIRESATIDIVQTYRLGDGPIDSWFAFICIAGLLCIQWGLRKSWNLP